MIALITPTGGRSVQIKHCAEFMKAQTYAGDVIWIIVDDCVPVTTDFITSDFRSGWEINKVYPTPKWRQGDNTQARNLQAAINVVKTMEVSSIWIIEDDDYYSPKYLSIMTGALEGFDIVGETDTIYYHIRLKRGLKSGNNKHSSLFQTGFKPSIIPIFEQVVSTKVKYIDIELFKAVPNVQFIKGLDLAIGIKGLPGRGGIGVGHNPRNYRRVTDDLTEKQSKTLRNIYG